MVLNSCGYRYDFNVWLYFDGKVHNVILNSIFLEEYQTV